MHACDRHERARRAGPAHSSGEIADVAVRFTQIDGRAKCVVAFQVTDREHPAILGKSKLRVGLHRPCHIAAALRTADYDETIGAEVDFSLWSHEPEAGSNARPDDFLDERDRRLEVCLVHHEATFEASQRQVDRQVIATEELADRPPVGKSAPSAGAPTRDRDDARSERYRCDYKFYAHAGSAAAAVARPARDSALWGSTNSRVASSCGRPRAAGSCRERSRRSSGPAFIKSLRNVAASGHTRSSPM